MCSNEDVSAKAANAVKNQRSPRMAFWSSAAVLALLILFPCSAAWAAGGSISGNVVDPSGGAILGVTVVVRNMDTGVEQTTTTNGTGFYAFPALDVGHYEIEFNIVGFKPYKRTGLVIDVGTALEADVGMQVGEQTQEVTVTDTGIHVETESSQMGEVSPTLLGNRQE